MDYQQQQDGPSAAALAALWVTCPGCRNLVYRRELADRLKVCPWCQHHMQLTPHEWLALLLDTTDETHDTTLAPGDPLHFSIGDYCYARRVAHAGGDAPEREALLSVSGVLGGHPLEVVVSDFGFLGGSMGSVYGERFARAAERAACRGVPLLSISTSGGARMAEGVVALMQMAKVAVALDLLADSGQVHIALLADPCYGGVTASYASVGDIVLAEPGARIGFTGRRVVAELLRTPLPEGYQTAEFLLEHGMIDAVVPRHNLRTILRQVLQIHYYAHRRRTYDRP